MHRSVLALVALATSFITAGARAEPPADDARPGATRAQAIVAFEKDCHATLQATAWVEGEELQQSECLARDIEQNCNPDVFGCMGDLDSCQLACQPGCSSCQDSCGGSCDSCKTACKAGDKACVHKCAEARADCRGGCMKTLATCQGATCSASMSACYATKSKRLKEGCTEESCNAFFECVQGQEDYEKASVVCEKKVKGLSGFCRDVCGGSGGMAFEMLSYAEYDAVSLEPDAALAKKCTKAAGCPAEYAAIAPYLAAFCAETLVPGHIETLSGEVGHGKISKKSVSVLLNIYGAYYGYEFKKEKWMNTFFYGDGAWLPAACKAKIKSVATAKAMPFKLTRLRDSIKGVWNQAP